MVISVVTCNTIMQIRPPPLCMLTLQVRGHIRGIGTFQWDDHYQPMTTTWVHNLSTSLAVWLAKTPEKWQSMICVMTTTTVFRSLSIPIANFVARERGGAHYVLFVSISKIYCQIPCWSTYKQKPPFREASQNGNVPSVLTGMFSFNQLEEWISTFGVLSNARKVKYIIMLIAMKPTIYLVPLSADDLKKYESQEKIRWLLRTAVIKGNQEETNLRSDFAKLSLRLSMHV